MDIKFNTPAFYINSYNKCVSGRIVGLTDKQVRFHEDETNDEYLKSFSDMYETRNEAIKCEIERLEGNKRKVVKEFESRYIEKSECLYKIVHVDAIIDFLKSQMDEVQQ